MEQKPYFDKTSMPDFATLLESYSDSDLASPHRSTVPLLSLFKDGQPMLQEILATCLMIPPLDFHFEFKVDPPRGEGFASHTDLMVQSGSHCLAIEAKWTEPMYPIVSLWLERKNKHPAPNDPNKDALGNDPTQEPGKDPSLNAQVQEPSNRKNVLDGWLGLMKPHARRNLVRADFGDCVYQMVHRAASACHGTKLPQLAYFEFTPPPDGRSGRHDEYRTRMESLHALLGSPVKFPFFIVEIQIAPTEAFHSIEKLPKGDRATGISVRNALRDHKLFEFISNRMKRIGRPGQ
jgi:hypothetical protein